MQRAVADHLRLAVVQVQHRRETHVDAARAQFGGEHVAERGGGFRREQNVTVPQFAELARRGQHGEAVGAEALHASTFVIDGDQDVIANVADRVGERDELRAVREVAREQDDAARHRMGDAANVRVGQRRADHVEHDGSGSAFQ